MKRLRVADVPKFRRPLKGSRARLGDSVYLNPGGLIYIKLLFMWGTCILLDFLIGFRVELLWPLWLMIRHLYDAFRVQNFVSSLHYSAFSVFFVCITATSDLICYLFIPVQVLVFIASTYVWIQFVYQSTERGFCTPSFLLWGFFVGVEYLMRCRFDQTTLYLTRGSWITAGMFSSDDTNDSIFVGNSQESLSRFEIYRPFAAHCIGYPIITLGFRVKSYFSSWRLRKKRMEVMKQNEVYYRLLADAIPAPYDGRQLSSSKQLALDNADFELDEDTISENGLVITSQPTVCTSINNGTANGLFTSATPPPPTAYNRKARAATLKSTSSLAPNKQNGYCGGGAAANGTLCTTTTKRTGRAATGSAPKREITQNGTKTSEPARRKSLPVYCFWLCQQVCRLAYDFLFAPMWSLLTTHLWSAVRVSKGANSDELLSVSGDGSLLADEESDREDLLGANSALGKANAVVGDDLIANTAKRRSKRTRGRTPAVAGEIMASNQLAQQQLKPTIPMISSLASKSIDSSSLASSKNNELQQPHQDSYSQSPALEPQQNGNFHQINGHDKNELFAQSGRQINGRAKEKSKSQEKCKCSIKIDELEAKLRSERGISKQQIINLEREKQILEQALDNLRNEMHQLRSSETGARAELTLLQSQERSQRAELAQLKSKLSEADQRAAQATRQLGKLRSATTPKVGGKLQETTNTRSGTPDQQQAGKELVDLRARIQTLEKELVSTQLELKSKQQAYTHLEQKLQSAEEGTTKETVSGNDEIKTYQQKLTDLQQLNARLEKTLMSENRLKVDLFRALSDSKAQIETLTAQIRQMESDRIRNGFEPSLCSSDLHLPSSLIASLANGFGSGNSSPTSPSSSPHTISTVGNVVSKSSTSIAEELEQILQNNGKFCYFGGDSFESAATPSTNAQARALAHQLKMSASPVANHPNNNINPKQSSSSHKAGKSSRSNSPSTNELFSMINGQSANSSFGAYGLTPTTTHMTPSTATKPPQQNGGSVSPAFH